jgi:amino acid adenylation domain-containing protein
MAEHLDALLRDSLARPADRVSTLRFLTAKERSQILAQWNTTAGSIPEAPDVVTRIAAQAERAPRAIAVVCSNDHVTYEALRARAGELARALRDVGVGPEVPVAVYLERSVELIIGILGILEAGGAFVPIDPDYPAPRVSFILEDAQPAVVLTKVRLVDRLTASSASVVCVDRPEDVRCGAPPAARTDPSVSARQLAYVLYTSGSTGRPNGVMVERGALTRYVETALQLYRMDPTDVCLQFASPSFDTGVEEIFTCLSAGGRLMLRSDAMIATVDDFFAQCDAWQVTVLNLPTAYWHEVAASWPTSWRESPSTIRLVIVGGERAERLRLAEWHQRVEKPIITLNTYGPTETTIVATSADISTASLVRMEDEVPIGRPIPHVRVYVLDRYGDLVPAGVPGEIYIGGAGVTRGYWQRPDLTAERFVPDPFGLQPGGRLFRTGDRGRYRADGCLEYVGRSDTQVKLRGQRIELGEIEAALRTYEAIDEAVVMVRGEGGDARLIAFVVRAESAVVTSDALRAALRETLPVHMVPSVFVFLDQMPLTQNLKIDQRALASVAVEPPFQAIQSPRNEMERTLADIWKEVLKLERVSVQDEFFEIGGHSLAAIKVMSRVRAAFGVDLAMVRLFEHTTIEALSKYIGSQLASASRRVNAPIVAVSRDQHLPVSVAQEELWWADRRFPNTPLFNIPLSTRLTGTVDITALTRAIEKVVWRHETLRTTFQLVDGQLSQIVSPQSALTLAVTDLSGVPKEWKELEAKKLAAIEAYRSFDLATGPLIRASVLILGPGEHVLLITLHHIVADAWSIEVLSHEIEANYASFLSGARPTLPELSIQYADFAAWQRESLRSGVWEDQFAYWKSRLGGRLPTQLLPFNGQVPISMTFDTARQAVALPRELSEALRKLGCSEGTSLFTVILAAFNVVLWSLKEQSEIRVATQVATRGRPETESLIGLFINTLILRTDVSGNPRFHELLRRVRTTTVDAFARQDLPFEVIVERLQSDPNFDPASLSCVLFLWESFEGKVLQLPGVVAEPVTLSSPLSDLGLTPTSCDLVVAFGEDRSGISGYLTYKTDRFDADTARQVVQGLRNVLAAVAADPQKRLRELSAAVGASI